MTLSYTYWYPTDIYGHTVRLPSHRAIQWLQDPTWERQRIRTMAQVIQPTDVVFDIGAEQGDMSALWAKLTPQGGVVLVEPNPKVWPCIFETFKENGLNDPIGSWTGFCGTAHTADQDPKRGWPEMDFGSEVIDPAAGFAHLAEQPDIACTSVDRLAQDFAVNVITIDVEGAEVEVLKGADVTLQTARPEVFVSVHPAFLRYHFDQTPADVFGLFAKYDYHCHVLESDHEVHVWATPL